MASVLAIINPKGKILCKEYYKNEVPPSTLDKFVKTLASSEIDKIPPCLMEDDCHFYFIHRNKLFFAATSKLELSRVVIFHFLDRFVSLVKDLCGVVHEDSVDNNLLLITELMREVMGLNGEPQSTNLEQLRPLIASEAFPVRSMAKFGLFGQEKLPSMHQPLAQRSGQLAAGGGHIYLDVIERLSVGFKADGTLLNFHLSGEMLLKSYLSGGSHEVKISLNPDLELPPYPPPSFKGFSRGLNLDLCLFSPRVSTEDFAKSRTLVVHPATGSEVIMRYEMWDGVPPLLPFHLGCQVDQHASDIDLTLRLCCADLPASAQTLQLTLTLPVPSSTVSVMTSSNIQHGRSDFLNSEHRVVWRAPTLSANSEAIFKFKLVEAGTIGDSALLELGPAILDFEISNFTCSGLRVRAMQVSNAMPQRFVRSATLASSYLFHLIPPPLQQ